ncbi:MAG: extracellular solute-binding protein [Clostridia bacterium]|nr:extracellular solute-binding protein [Clostridia bacterium]
MMKAKFRKLTALLLAILTVLSGSMLGISAADDGQSVTDQTIDEIRELLNAISYEEYLEDNADVPRAAKDIVINALDYDKDNTDAAVVVKEWAGEKGLHLPSVGTASWKVNIPSTAKYSIVLEYYPDEGKVASAERIFMINGKVPFAEARYLTMTKVWKNQYEEPDEEGRLFRADIDRNELRPTMNQTPEWRTYELHDADGFYTESFEFVLEKGENILSLEAVNEPLTVKSIHLVAHEDLVPYAEIKAEYDAKGYKPASAESVVSFEAEYPVATSSQTIYPIEDRTSAATVPQDASRSLLNTIGGDKWQNAGQWIRYEFTVPESGLYQIVPRFKQELLDGMFVSRTLRINGEVPFKEATSLRFNYSTDWQTAPLNDGTTEFEFYFEAGKTYTIEFEVALGEMGEVIRDIDNALSHINADYLEILKLTGATPDEYRDYGFSRIMPDTIIDMIIQSQTIEEVSAMLSDLAGTKGSNTATLDKVAFLLDRMGSDEDEVAKNLEQMKSYIGSLGTWVGDMKSQPLRLDYIVVQPAGNKLPKAEAGFFSALGFEIQSFFQSFFRNYNRMGAITDTSTDENAVEVWLAYGRDQTQVIRNLINNDFTPKTGIPVNLKLVAGGTLLPSVLANMGPDVYIGLGQGDVINYAIRSAIKPIENFEGFEETLVDFNDAAMLPLGIEDAEGVFHYYGLPETQSFPMMFYRKDILAELGIDIPKTWDDILAAVPILQANNMTIGLSKDYKMFLYQMGGELFADNGMRINLDSNVALESFEMMCNMFTMYSFPYKYDFANRFRTGEMPIGIAAYNGTYNQLIVFATEIRGLWEFVPLPGIVDENGNINNVSVSTVSAIVMMNGCDNEEGAWEFMKWHVGAECQRDYSNEMVAILGPSAKHATANEKALESLPWTTSEYENLALQFNNLASIPNYPGSYILDRYTNFAFLAAYNSKADPVEQLLSYIPTINKEITRKRNEFGLPVLELGQTLADLEAAQNGGAAE